MNTVLVTGGTGTVGTHLVRDLRARGESVRVLTRDPARGVLFSDDVEVAIGDLGAPTTVTEAMVGVDRVFLAVTNHPEQVAGETNVIDAAAAAGVRRIVKLSVLGPELGSPFAFSDAHARIEDHLTSSAVPAVVLQPTFFMTNLLASATTIAHAGRFFLPAGDAKVAMIDPRDIAAVAATVLTSDGDEGATYRLTGPEAITFTTVADQLARALGRPVQYVDVPDDAAREAMVASGMPPWFADNLVVLFGLLRAGANDQTSDDVRRVTGREPRSFADFARDHAAAFSAAATPARR